MKYYIGIDNGVSGSIGVVNSDSTYYRLYKTPVKKELSYTKTKQYIERVDFEKFYSMIAGYKTMFESDTISILVLFERPMVNPGRFKATLSAMRCLESQLIVIERLGIPFQYIDSKAWQTEMLPSGLKGPELKVASSDIGRRLFPNCKDEIIKQKDADGLLIAEYAKQKKL